MTGGQESGDSENKLSAWMLLLFPTPVTRPRDFLMKILVTGAGGMMGSAVAEHCRASGDEVFAHNHQSLDITDDAAVRAALAREIPDTVINCAAWTDVDGCELDPQKAFMENGRAVEILAVESRRAGASLVTISTDYVFDGERTAGFYTQRDDPHPESVYGAAKLEGERRAQMALARTTVVRTGWIYGAGGRNFLATILERGRRGKHLKDISDVCGPPTYSV